MRSIYTDEIHIGRSDPYRPDEIHIGRSDPYRQIRSIKADQFLRDRFTSIDRSYP
jgi:hypothetical protein